MSFIRELLESCIGKPGADPEPEFLGGGPPLPVEDQNVIVNYALFTIGILVSCLALTECSLLLAAIGGLALGTFTNRMIAPRN